VDKRESTYFFVCGAPKSGTTWLQRLLDAHPQVVCSGEGHFVEELVLPIMRIRDRYNQVLAQADDVVYEGNPYHPKLSDRDLVPHIKSLIITLMQKRLKPGARAIGDKTPRYYDFLDRLKILFPDARFLHIVRDPRDVAVSLFYHGARRGWDTLVVGSAMRRHLVFSAMQNFLDAVEKFARFSAADPTRCLEVRYEDLSAEPRPILQAAFDLLGVPATTQAIDEVVASASFENWSARARGQEDAQSFFRKGIVGDWKTALHRDEIDDINAVCGTVMRQKNYSVA
jgi:LPS sulfotransferase NodH